MTTSTADRVLAALARYDLKEEGNGKWRSNSPLRPGSNSHAFCLRIDGPEYGAYYDQVSGESGTLYKLADAMGLERTRQQQQPVKRQMVVAYDYVDAEGKLLYQACRFEPGKDGRSKDFTQRRPDGNGGWVWDMKGVQRVLYRLPEVLAAVKAGQPVFIVEGEKEADRLALLGLTATTNVGGAGKWLKTYSATLKGAHVVVLPDNDEAGERHKDEVIAALLGSAAEVRTAPLPGLVAHGDVSDWIDAGHTRAELLTLVETSPAAATDAAAQADSNDEPARATDLGNARRLVRLYGDRIRYVHTWGAWLVWNGARWVKDETGEIHRLARETVRAIYAEVKTVEDLDARRTLARWAMQSESAGKLAAMVELTRSEPGVAVHHTALDADPWLLNCMNGTVDLRTGELRPHNRSDLLTKLVPIAFDAQAAAPTWARFLERITNEDASLADYMQRAAGYTLTGDVGEQCLFFLYGAGSNGKSTFVEALSDLLGDYWMKAPAEMLMQQRNAGIPNDIAMLPGARMVVASEMADGRRLDEAKVKDLTGGDTLTARFMRQEWFTFRPVFKLWMYGNYKPVIRGTDNGIWRRIRLIPFTATISDEEKDPALSKKLRAELPGILAWTVQGCLAWQRDGLQAPDVVKAATDAYRNEMDIIGAFLEERCILRPNARTAATPLYKAYIAWCEANGEHPLPQKQFGQRLDLRGLPSKRTGKAFMRLGVALLEANQAELPTDDDPMIRDDPKINIPRETSNFLGDAENRITTDHGSHPATEDVVMPTPPSAETLFGVESPPDELEDEPLTSAVWPITGTSAWAVVTPPDEPEDESLALSRAQVVDREPFRVALKPTRREDLEASDSRLPKANPIWDAHARPEPTLDQGNLVPDDMQFGDQLHNFDNGQFSAQRTVARLSYRKELADEYERLTGDVPGTWTVEELEARVLTLRLQPTVLTRSS